MSGRDILSLARVAAEPSLVTFRPGVPAEAVLQPLAASHEAALAAFFAGLSATTRRFYSVTGSGESLAREHCTAINHYDKLRLVLSEADNGGIIALVEFSFDLPAGDVERFAAYGIALDPRTDCRWGLCVTDAWQGRGVGTALTTPSWEIARRFGRQRLLLWGGVYAENRAAVGYYRKVGFTEVGRFLTAEGVSSIDMLRDLDP